MHRQLVQHRFPYLLCLLVSVNAVATDINTEQVEKDHQLQNIRSQIKKVESGIEDAKNEVDQLFRQLRKNELAAVDVSAKLHAYEEQIKAKKNKLLELNKESKVKAKLLDSQRRLLAQQVRAAYKTGRSNYLKLLLNQEDPNQVGRMLAYYEYDARARSEHITNINAALREINLLEENIQKQTQQLSILQEKQRTKLEEFQSYRDSREGVRDKLQAYINQQDIQLQFLLKDEQELAELVGKLEHQELVIQVYEDMPPFNSLQGKLDWPVRGKIASRFGGLRKGGKLKWQGVTIAARSGVEVNAVSTGKVVFADWFRNMGLLIILDHGDGFMSLYGHNERLLKKPGDWVLAGELIARVGDTGGQQQPGLYFEIRQSGNPINPNLWCKN